MVQSFFYFVFRISYIFKTECLLTIFRLIQYIIMFIVYYYILLIVNNININIEPHVRGNQKLNNPQLLLLLAVAVFHRTLSRNAKLQNNIIFSQYYYYTVPIFTTTTTYNLLLLQKKSFIMTYGIVSYRI